MSEPSVFDQAMTMVEKELSHRRDVFFEGRGDSPDFIADFYDNQVKKARFQIAAELARIALEGSDWTEAYER